MPQQDRQFKCKDLIQHEDGRGSLGKIGQLTALVVSSLCFFWMIWTNTMTEFYFVGYMVAWSGANIAGKVADRSYRRYRGDRGARHPTPYAWDHEDDHF